MIQYINALNNYWNTKAFLILKFDQMYIYIASSVITSTYRDPTEYDFVLHFTNFNAQNTS